jgi:hypothetical protein
MVRRRRIIGLPAVDIVVSALHIAGRRCVKSGPVVDRFQPAREHLRWVSRRGRQAFPGHPGPQSIVIQHAQQCGGEIVRRRFAGEARGLDGSRPYGELRIGDHRRQPGRFRLGQHQTLRVRGGGEREHVGSSVEAGNRVVRHGRKNPDVAVQPERGDPASQAPALLRHPEQDQPGVRPGGAHPGVRLQQQSRVLLSSGPADRQHDVSPWYGPGGVRRR